GHELTVGDGESVVVNPVSVGNPHCVVIVGELRRDDFARLAPRLSAHPAFRAGTNVQFVRATGPASLELLVWERGAGRTPASGSSATAAAACAVRLGLVEPGPITVTMDGGEVEVTVSTDGDLRLVGPAQMI